MKVKKWFKRVNFIKVKRVNPKALWICSWSNHNNKPQQEDISYFVLTRSTSCACWPVTTCWRAEELKNTVPLEQEFKQVHCVGITFTLSLSLSTRRRCRGRSWRRSSPRILFDHLLDDVFDHHHSSHSCIPHYCISAPALLWPTIANQAGSTVCQLSQLSVFIHSRE